METSPSTCDHGRRSDGEMPASRSSQELTEQRPEMSLGPPAHPCGPRDRPWCHKLTATGNLLKGFFVRPLSLADSSKVDKSADFDAKCGLEGKWGRFERVS